MLQDDFPNSVTEPLFSHHPNPSACYIIRFEYATLDNSKDLHAVLLLYKVVRGQVDDEYLVKRVDVLVPVARTRSNTLNDLFHVPRVYENIRITSGPLLLQR